MKKPKNEQILDALSWVNEKYITESAPKMRRSKWIALAACLCLIVGLSVAIALMSPAYDSPFMGMINLGTTSADQSDDLTQAGGMEQSSDHSDQPYNGSVFQSLQTMGLPVEQVASPKNSVSSDMEINLEASIEHIRNSNLLVKGTVRNPEYLRIKDDAAQKYWFIIAYTIEVESVINGEVTSDELRIISLEAWLSFKEVPAKMPNDFFVLTSLTQFCSDGEEGLFVLDNTDESSAWTICEENVALRELADYHIDMFLKEKDGKLTYYGFDLGITVEELTE